MAGGGGSGSGARPSDKTARAPTTTAIHSTIQSIKEVVGGHSDADIYDALRESNMDPNETAQKLLYQDPFHEVKRKRDKKERVLAIRALQRVHHKLSTVPNGRSHTLKG